MVGGIVTKVIPDGKRLQVNCEEPNSASRGAVFVERDEKSEQIKPGDSFWWQGGYAMHTPFENTRKSGGRCGVDYDRKLKRIGCSFNPSKDSCSRGV